MSDENDEIVIKTAEQRKQERMKELADKLLPEEVEITDAELDNTNRAPDGEQFGYEKGE